MKKVIVTRENLSEYENAVDSIVARTKALMTAPDNAWKVFFSMDTESAGVNVRSVGFGIFLAQSGTPSRAYCVGGVNIDIFPRGVTNPQDCEAADRAAVDGERTMNEFWKTRMDTYNTINANSIPTLDAIRCINILHSKFNSISKDLHIVLTARPLTYDYTVLQRLYDNEGMRNPFPPLGWYAFCMGTAYAFRSGNGAYSYNNFNTLIKKLGKEELDHVAMNDGIDQFHAYWLFLCEHYGPTEFVPIE
jgi:hypothetical protein